MPYTNNPNSFSCNPLDRASHLREDPSWLESAQQDGNSRFVALHHLKPLIKTAADKSASGSIAWLDSNALKQTELSTTVFLGLQDGTPCFAVDVSNEEEQHLEKTFNQHGAFTELLAAVNVLGAEEASILAQAKSMIDWHRRHGFCANCGSSTTLADAGYRRDCPECKAQHFPRTDPVVISLVIRDDKCLLGRNAMFQGPMFTALAGFLEPGETIEQAVAREVMEEVGVAVDQVSYQFTQPWPYPSSLMIGCAAQAQTETITVDDKEIIDARWFSRDELREALRNPERTNYQAMLSHEGEFQPEVFFLPPATAIAHQLLLAWVDQ